MRACSPHILTAIFILLGSCYAAQTDQRSGPTEKPLFNTAVTGSTVGVSGLDDPQYVLSFIPVQQLMLTTVQHPVSKQEINKALIGTPVALDDLVRLELLRQDKDVYRLNYLLLTLRDQETMYHTTERFGRSLADAFRAHRKEFEVISSLYPNSALRPQVMFDLVAGAALNWGGLDLTTELGYRIKPQRLANGASYFVHSAEGGAKLNFAGLYLDSQSAPGSTMSFSTFGDGDSLPRLYGIPDVFDGIESATENWRKTPKLYAALQNEYVTLLLLAIDDAGLVMNAVSNGNDTQTALAKSVSIPEARLKATLQLLVATGYLNENQDRYSFGVPVLAERDKPLVDATLEVKSPDHGGMAQAELPCNGKRVGGAVSHAQRCAVLSGI